MGFWVLIPEMNTSRKAMECLICFSIINLMLGSYLLKNVKKTEWILFDDDDNDGDELFLWYGWQKKSD